MKTTNQRTKEPNSRIPAEISMPGVIWHHVDDEMPDDCTTVLIHTPEANEPVWIGYYENETWWETCVHGSLEVTVTHWAHLPDPPK